MIGLAICSVTVAPLRKEANDASEMVSQILFGEKTEILKVDKNWTKIKLLYDDYVGWCDTKQLCEINVEEASLYQQPSFVSETYDFALLENQFPFPLLISSELYLNENIMKLGNYSYHFDGALVGNTSTQDLVSIAIKYLNVPYLWGGKSSFGIDCSGFVQQVFKLSGHKLPRDAYQQAEFGTRLDFLEETEPGDLVFFDNIDGKIIHVGILLNSKQIIHAHGKVRIDSIDQSGIFNVDTKTHSHKLRLIKRII